MYKIRNNNLFKINKSLGQNILKLKPTDIPQMENENVNALLKVQGLTFTWH